MLNRSLVAANTKTLEGVNAKTAARYRGPIAVARTPVIIPDTHNTLLNSSRGESGDYLIKGGLLASGGSRDTSLLKKKQRGESPFSQSSS